MNSLASSKPSAEHRAFSASTGRCTSQLPEHASVPPKEKPKELKTGLKQHTHPNEQGDDEACVRGEAERPLPTSEKPDAD